MSNLAITYQHIADILSFETSTSKLEQTLSHPSFDWDKIVIEGSKHLVLPAIYCRLKDKQLLHVLPQDLNNYLKEITALNRNRNEAIIKQVHSISKLFIQNNINHTFLKGSALLIFGCFLDNAERMIGDIDILVSLNDLEKAFNLLKNKNYTPIEQTFGFNFFEHKHLPRLKPKRDICSVELHKKLFVSYNNDELKCEAILKDKVNHSEVSTPSLEHLLKHNILNFQINDKGALYNSISIRSAYDTTILLQNMNEKIIGYNCQIFKSYFNLHGLFFNDIKLATNSKSNLITSFYFFKLKHLRFYKYWNHLLKLSNHAPILLNRFYYFLLNKSYRKAVFNDRKRIYSYFKSILSDF